MASREFYRNFLSLDDKLITLEAVADFGSTGAPLLQQWQPESVGASIGAYDDAPIGGCEGVVGVFKRGTGDFRIVLQDSYVRLKGLLPSYENSAHLGVAAPFVKELAGSIVDLYPDCTSLSVERLEAGSSGLAVDSSQPTFTLTNAEWGGFTIGMILTDSAGAIFDIVAVDDDTLILSGTSTPAVGLGWTISINGTVLFDTNNVPGTPSAVAFVPATFTVSGATWLVNRWKGHYLQDYAGNLLEIASNTATVLTLVAVPAVPSPVLDGMSGTGSAGLFTVTGSGSIIPSGALTGKAFTDGTNIFYITGNSALTATTGTISVIGTPTTTITNTGGVNNRPMGAVSGPYVIEQGFPLGNQYPVTGPQVTGSANTGTGSANTWTPAATTNWVAGIFSGMWLLDGSGVYWRITANSTAALTVANNGSSTTPTTGATWSIVSVAGGASVEISTGTLSGTASGLTFTGVAHTLAGTNGTSAVTGTAAAQTFTGESYTPAGTNNAPAFTGTAGGAAVNNTPVFSGTGYAAVGQVITTTGTFTMTLNQLAGMWFVSVSGDVVEIVSNTAVVGAVAVLTVRGKATTDVGVFDIFSGPTPGGTVAAPTFPGSAHTLAGTNGTSAVTGTAAAQTFTGESYTPAGTVTGSLAAVTTAANPAGGERLLITLILSDGTVMG